MLIPYIKNSSDYLKSKLNLDRNDAVNVALFSLFAVIVLMPEMSYAQNNAASAANIGVDDAVCRIVNELQGKVARGVAAFGIIFLGFSLFLGKISWGVALALGIGIGAIFGAPQIVNVIAGSGDAGC
jgi:type IV secretion system protein VirB2